MPCSIKYRLILIVVDFFLYFFFNWSQILAVFTWEILAVFTWGFLRNNRILLSWLKLIQFFALYSVLIVLFSRNKSVEVQYLQFLHRGTLNSYCFKFYLCLQLRVLISLLLLRLFTQHYRLVKYLTRVPFVVKERIRIIWANFMNFITERLRHLAMVIYCRIVQSKVNQS